MGAGEMGPVIVAAVAAQRLAELAVARRNAARLLAQGAREAGATHYPLFVILHGGWLLAVARIAVSGAPVNWLFVAALVPLLAARVWVMVSLGPFWTTRIITLPDAPLIRRGPYRFCRHPNYWIVAGEIAILPLVFGAWRLALTFSVANALLLAHRIRVENAALAQRRDLSARGRTAAPG